MEVSKTPKKKEDASVFQKNGKTYAAMVMIRW